ncbi:hypothetical protein ACIOYV_11775 [Pseudomonas sp. NPDC087342]|uniref:hypothetical protein n=1 Tax=Pseudomonas sp. NPDC087342 TaxID=3364437 RepID=UPI00382A82EA
MTDILSEIGIESCAFGSADDALTYLLEAHGHCPLVIVDQGLPGQIKGAEFIAMVKGKWPSVASILTSGYAIEEAMVPPSTIYLHKPWALDDLVLAVAHAPPAWIPPPEDLTFPTTLNIGAGFSWVNLNGCFGSISVLCESQQSTKSSLWRTAGIGQTVTSHSQRTLNPFGKRFVGSVNHTVLTATLSSKSTWPHLSPIR